MSRELVKCFNIMSNSRLKNDDFKNFNWWWEGGPRTTIIKHDEFVTYRNLSRAQLLKVTVNNGTVSLKIVENCWNTNIYSYLDTSVGQSSNIDLNVVHFFNTSVN